MLSSVDHCKRVYAPMGPQTSVNDKGLPDYCRLCLIENVQMVVPRDEKVLSQLAIKIKECLQLFIPIDDLRKSLICKNCYETLEQLHQFRTRSLRYNIYYFMRKSLDPDRKQSLRYGGNWYWYSCLGNDMNSVYWGCSVVCCPAYIVSFPSGKIMPSRLEHQHKQKMDEIKQKYCNGEYVFDGFRYSFEMITAKRTLMFKCRSLNDPHRKCPAILYSNDRTEVIHVSEHNHQREIFIESGVLDAVSKESRSITMIRGKDQKILVCQGYWYRANQQNSNVSSWNCIRPRCTSLIIMNNGCVDYRKPHSHGPVFLKWGAKVNKPMDPKIPMMMKVINPTGASSTASTSATLPSTFAASRSAGTSFTRMETSQNIFEEPNLVEDGNEHHVSSNQFPILPFGSIKVEKDTEESFSNDMRKSLDNSALRELDNSSSYTDTGNAAIPTSHPVKLVRSKTPKNTVAFDPTPAPKIVPRPRSTPILSDVNKSRVRSKPSPRFKTPPTRRTSNTVFPKILHVMSLNKNPSVEHSQPDLDPDQSKISPVRDPLLLTRIKQEPNTFHEEDTEAESNSNNCDNIPDQSSLTVGAVSVGNANLASLTDDINSEENEDDQLLDLQDDGDIPPIVPVDEVSIPKSADDEGGHRLKKIKLSNKKDTTNNSNAYTVCEAIKQVFNATLKRPANKVYPSAKRAKHEPDSNPATTFVEPAENALESTDTPEMDDPFKDVSSDPIDLPYQPPVEPIKLCYKQSEIDTGDEADCSAMQSSDSPKIPSTETTKNVPLIYPIRKALSASPSPRFVPSPARLLSTDSSKSKENGPKKTVPQTVQLVKLQKIEQMLNFEGHLYKMKWCHQQLYYWDCMLREQVNCMAILKTVGNDSKRWSICGLHSHKVPKPIANDETCGKYQMLTANSDLSGVKRPTQVLGINNVTEQAGRMTYLDRRKMFNFKISRQNGQLMLNFASYVYKIVYLANPGFRWKCTECPSMIDTDEHFSLAKEINETHTHNPKLTVIDLDQDDNSDNSTDKKPAIKSDGQMPPMVQIPYHKLEPVKSDKTKLFDAKITPSPIAAAAESGEDSAEPAEPTIDTAEEQSDDEEMILDPLHGEFISRGDLKRRENQEALTKADDEDDDDDDDDEIILDPLTGTFRRKGESVVLNDVDVPEKEPTEIDSSQQSAQLSQTVIDDFEELLQKSAIADAERSTPKPKKMKPGSLDALHASSALYKKLQQEIVDRNFTVLPQDDGTCLIRYLEFTYELDSIQPNFSVWKCHLSPLYACRGKLQLDNQHTEATVSNAYHCHAPDLKDMFIGHAEREEGEIRDTDANIVHKYIMLKQPKHVYLLQLDDGHVYSCVTVSKTGVGCWRCISRQKQNCKAIITMEGDFKSLARNRFSHSHDPESLDAVVEKQSKSKDVSFENDNDTSSSSSKAAAKKIRKRKR